MLVPFKQFFFKPLFFKNFNIFLRNMSTNFNKVESRLSGKTILITGASSGIGEATAKEFASLSRGNIKLILAARRTEKLIHLKENLEKSYPNIHALSVTLDVSKTENIPKFIQSLPKEFSDIDVLVNNAGFVFGTEKVGDIKTEDVSAMFATNVLGLIALTQEVVRLYKQKNKGDIINIGSIAGRDPYPGGGIYCATKAAVYSFTESLRKETINTGIRVIEVDPGQVETEFSVVRFRGDKQKADAVYKGGEPLTPEDIAEVIVFAASRRANTVIANTLVFPTHQAGAAYMYKKE